MGENKFKSSLIFLVCLSYSEAVAKCIHDPAGNESTCGYEARMTVAKRHGFSDLSHGEIDSTIAQSFKMRGEWQNVYDLCTRRNNFCE